MPKGKRSSGEGGDLFEEVERIISLLSADEKQELVILAIPSHDKKNRALDELKVKERASSALDLFADLYHGATAFETFAGIYKTDDGTYLRDRPILVQSYASLDAIQDPIRLNELVGFAKRMGKELNQDAIMIVIGQAMIYISDYSGVN